MKIPLFHIEEGLFLEIIGESDNSLKEISDDEVMEFGEAKYQLIEGCTYEYQFSKNNYSLSDEKANDNPIVSISKFNKYRGRLNPNIYVGTHILHICDNTLSPKGTLNLEVQSIKSDYRTDYRYMLESITDKCTDLIMQIDSPVQQHFETDFNVDSQTLYQRFSFVKSVIDSKEFEEAIQKIISSPTVKWESESEEKDVRNVRNLGQKEIRQLASKGNRMSLPDTHFLSRQYGICSVPNKIECLTKAESIDTAENRFIKHALEEFSIFCEKCEAKFALNSRAKLEASILSDKMSNFLSQSFFKDISRPDSLKLNSPILQRKSGYREILNIWLKFDLAAKLVWKGGDNVYHAGKKDIATLYEYWLFFTLLDILKDIFNIEPKKIQELIQFDKGKLSLNLCQGKMIAMNGVFDSLSRKLNIQFSYNKSFGGKKKYPAAGSWTTTLRPDYTLSIWPTDLNIVDAEQKELITHIHFDAKYKVSNFYDLINESKDDKELSEEKETERKGTYKNADLLKMHAYKDAIRRTGGAYVLYPGVGKEKPFRGFHELIPGLGAFTLKPNKDETDKEELKAFILKVVDNFIDRASQREHLSSKIYEIHKKEKEDINVLHERMPEYFDKNSKENKLIPDETFVLVGYCSSPQKLKWHNDKLLYNFRMDNNKGSLVLDNEVVNAKYLLLRERGKDFATQMYKIKSKGPKVYSKSQLEKMDYPNPSQDYYLVVEIESFDASEFSNTVWDFKKLDKYNEVIQANPNPRIGSGIPFVVTLSELMRKRIEL